MKETVATRQRMSPVASGDSALALAAARTKQPARNIALITLSQIGHNDGYGP